MSVFPTQYSTLSSLALGEFLGKAYGLGEVICKFLTRNVSDTYVLEGESDKYIFKLYRDAHRHVDEIKAEAELLTILKERGAKVAYPISDLAGNQLQSFNAAEGTRYGILFNFAPGKFTRDLTEKRLRIIGQEMAFIHNITSEIELQFPRRVYDVQTTLIGPLENIKPAFVELPDEYAYLKETTQKVIAKLSQFDLSKFSYGYCHYDFLPKNFHFDENDLVTFFDFDFAGKGVLANDLMSFFVHFFFEVEHKFLTKEEADRQFAQFITAYREVRPLSDAEIEAIPYLGYAFWLFFFEFYQLQYEDWSNTFFGPTFKKQRVALMKKWIGLYCDFSSLEKQPF
ncbi:phosphotransferase enzyme family protein [Dyadobacter sp. CY323]|uniref:phosphotransferase enzyme family protein n=1 Tax=Dyadobacter sp. CY323 TaxID=2907302 RepID=UPI001F2B3E71|nr:phosphotransferase [Dyadobacter sp. CY323]MCE6992704.1 phosphotransferase [Dyadobacter sp. CY323]